MWERGRESESLGGSVHARLMGILLETEGALQGVVDEEEYFLEDSDLNRELGLVGLIAVDLWLN